MNKQKKLVYILIVFIAISVFPLHSVQAKTMEMNRGKDLRQTVIIDGNSVELITNTSNSNYTQESDEFSNNCYDFSPSIRIIGFVILILKISIPLIIIVKSSLNLFSTVTKGKFDELQKNAKRFATSLIAGAIIFLLPTAINAIFNLVGNFSSGMPTDNNVCNECIFKPYGSACEDAVKNRSE